MKTVLAGVALLLFVVAVPLAILSAHGLAVSLDADFYSREQVQQQVDALYGLPQRVLAPVNRAVIRYFLGSETLAGSLQAEGADPAFFNQRETIHMEDVRGLFRGAGQIQRFSLAYGILFVLASVLLLGTKGVGRIGAGLVAGGLLTIAVVAILGALSLLDFGDLLLRFHLLSFSNDYWQLDPRTDHLIQMTGFVFFRDAVLLAVFRSLVTAVGVIGLGGLLIWLGRRLR